MVASHATPTGDTPETQACALTGNQTSDALIHRLALHPLIYTSQGDFFKFIFREMGREEEREGEKHQCVVASHMPPTGDLAHNPGMSPDWE